VGVLACSCWSRSDEGVDADAIVAGALMMDGVVHAEATDDLCGRGHATLGGDLVRRHSLDRLVVAACACCPQDQRCPACDDERAGLREAVKAASDLPWSHHAFVNVRTHYRATEDKVTAVAMAVARLSHTPDHVPTRAVRLPTRVAMVVGASSVGRSAAVELGERGIPTHLVDQAAPPGTGDTAPRNITLHVPAVVARIEGGAGDLTVTLSELGEERTVQVGVVLVAPGLTEETSGTGVGWGLPHRTMASPPSRVQGIVLVGEDGVASAGAAAAFLGRTIKGAEAVAVVDEEACIGCLKCARVCPYSAITRAPGGDLAVVDPVLCTGCGACASSCMNWAIHQVGQTTQELEAAITAGVSRTPGLLVVCNWAAYRAMDQAFADGMLPRDLAVLRLSCLSRMSPHLVQVALAAGADPLFMAGCSDRGCHFRGRRALLDEHMRNLEPSLAGSDDLDRVFVLSLGPADKDVLAIRVGEALEERRYAREERQVREGGRTKGEVGSRGWPD
jgi:coenzyme F420-reducing hydrogenase delta subunit/Pyruvate/2-oxoacid:ferredoxin oxidoreductase delta subunit